MDDNSDNQSIKVTFADIDLAKQLFGEYNSNLQKIAAATDIALHARGNTVFIQGDDIAADLAQNVLNQLYGLLKEKFPIYPNDIDYAVRILSSDNRIKLKDIFLDTGAGTIDQVAGNNVLSFAH